MGEPSVSRWTTATPGLGRTSGPMVEALVVAVHEEHRVRLDSSQAITAHSSSDKSHG